MKCENQIGIVHVSSHDARCIFIIQFFVKTQGGGGRKMRGKTRGNSSQVWRHTDGQCSSTAGRHPKDVCFQGRQQHVPHHSIATSSSQIHINIAGDLKSDIRQESQVKVGEWGMDDKQSLLLLRAAYFDYIYAPQQVTHFTQI